MNRNNTAIVAAIVSLFHFFPVAGRAAEGPAPSCAELPALKGASGAGLTALLHDPDPRVRACAIRAAGETKDPLAETALLNNVASYLAGGKKSVYETDLKARLRALDSIWALGEIGNPETMDRLLPFYYESDDTVRINIVISVGKMKKATAAPVWLRAVAANPAETAVVRAAAFEMLDYQGKESSLPGLLPSAVDGIEKGDILYTGGVTGTFTSWLTPDMPVGHTGLFAGVEYRNGRIHVKIADCVPNYFNPGGVRNIDTFKKFTLQYNYAFYGNRTSAVRPTPAQRELLVRTALEMGGRGLRYSNLHFLQKGPEIFDCVGYTEYLYELVGLNPTDNSLETGWGWPLTPLEQFEGTVSNARVRAAPAMAGRPARALNAMLLDNFSALQSAFDAGGTLEQLEVPEAREAAGF